MSTTLDTPPTDATTAGTATAGTPRPGRTRMAPAAGPVGTPPAAVVSVLLCLALLGLGVVLLRDVLVGREVAGRVLVPGEPWLAPLAASATAVLQGRLAVAAGVAGVLLALVLLVVALRRRPPRAVRLHGPGEDSLPLDVDGSGVAALAADAALADDAVESSRAVAGRRSVQVRVVVDPRDQVDTRALSTAVGEQVRERLDGLHPAPRVQVRVHGGSS